MKKPAFTAVQSMIELSQIIVLAQTRKIFIPSEIQEIADSIKIHGLLQPIAVLKQEDGTYRLIFGECRLRAFQILKEEDQKYNQIECRVYQNLSPADILEIQIIENINRNNISPLEEAEAFKDLIEVRNISFKETALIAGKSASFVLQRMKLLDLTDNFREALKNKRLTIGDALKVALLKDTSQDMLWEKRFAHVAIEKSISVSQDDVNKLLGSLSDATFDKEDIALIPGAGACSLCPYNSACNTMLFPDMAEDSTCSNINCFSAKTDKAFENELLKVSKESDVVLVSLNYSDKSEFVLELEAMGLEVLNYSRFDKMVFNDEMPDIEDFEEELEEGVYEDREEMQSAFDDAMESYNEELADFNERKNTCLVKRAFCVEGRDKGKYFDVVIGDERSSSTGYGKEKKPTAKELQEKIKAGTVSEKDIDNEVQRLHTAEARKKELDDEKAMPFIYAALKENTEFPKLNSELIKAEKIGLALLLFENSGWSVQQTLKKIAKLDDTDSLCLYNKLEKKKPEEIDKLIAQFSRVIMVEKFRPSAGQSFSTSGYCAGLKGLVNAYDSEKLQIIENDIEANRKKRAKKLEENLTGLEAKRVDIKAQEKKEPVAA